MYSKNFGANCLLPDIKSIAAPIPIETQFNFLKLSYIQISCLGAPNATNNISTFDLLISI